MQKIGIIIPVYSKQIKEKINELDRKLPIDHYTNLSTHISIYIWESLDDIRNIKNKFKEIIKNFKPFYINTNKVAFSEYKTVQLKIAKNNKLYKLHEKIVKEMSQFIDKNADSRPKQFYSTFNKKEKYLIDSYGRPNVLENFKPHITLEKIPKEKIKNIKDFLKSFHPKIKVRVNNIHLVKIKEDDFKIISNFKLKNI